jgi:virginiamycin B lyase
MRTHRIAVVLVALLTVAPLSAPANAEDTTIYEIPGGQIQRIAFEYGAVWYTISDPAPARLGRLDPRTGDVEEWTSPTVGGAISDVLAAFGAVWYSDEPSGQLGEFDPRTGEITVHELPQGAEPSRIAAGFGHLWYTSPGADVIGRFDPRTGEAVEYSIPTIDAVPVGIDTGFGSVWFAEVVGNRIGRLDPRTGEITEYELDPDTQPIGLSVGADGIWFASFPNGTVGQLDHRTGEATYYEVYSADPEPEADFLLEIIAGPRGDVWLPIPQLDRLVQIDPRTGQVTRHVLPPSDGAELGIASGGGHIWLGSDVIIRFTP